MPFVTIRVADGLLGSGEEAKQKKVEINRRLIDAISPSEWYAGYKDVVQMRRDSK